MEKDKQCQYDLRRQQYCPKSDKDKMQKQSEIHFTYVHRRKNPRINNS